ncbi:hypothetical protein AeRB84_003614 [Aphanomyces euteiches]|nr:hypothetical protein AeRB84_003614 [Aphanomyces euteiches]
MVLKIVEYNLYSTISANHVLGTLIVSDKFSAYVSANERNTLANNPALARMGYSHMWVNHSRNFVNPVNGARAQSIEGVWEVRIKQYLKAMRGVRSDQLQSYLDMCDVFQRISDIYS